MPAMKNARIAAAELSAEMGATKDTPGRYASHVTWWVPIGVSPCEPFRVVG